MFKTIIITLAFITLFVGYFLPIPQIRQPVEATLNFVSSSVGSVHDKYFKNSQCSVQIKGTIEGNNCMGERDGKIPDKN